MTAHVAMDDAKRIVFHTFNIQGVFNYQLWSEDFQTFKNNIGGCKFFSPSDRSMFVYDALLGARYKHPKDGFQAHASEHDEVLASDAATHSYAAPSSLFVRCV